MEGNHTAGFECTKNTPSFATPLGSPDYAKKDSSEVFNWSLDDFDIGKIIVRFLQCLMTYLGERAARKGVSRARASEWLLGCDQASKKILDYSVSKSNLYDLFQLEYGSTNCHRD